MKSVFARLNNTIQSELRADFATLELALLLLLLLLLSLLLLWWLVCWCCCYLALFLVDEMKMLPPGLGRRSHFQFSHFVFFFYFGFRFLVE